MDEKGLTKSVVLFSFFPSDICSELELAPVIEIELQPVAVASSGQSLNHSVMSPLYQRMRIRLIQRSKFCQLNFSVQEN